MKLLKRKVKRFRKSLSSINVIRKRRKEWCCIAIHKSFCTDLPSSIVIPLIARHTKRKLSCPAELTILLIHNYDTETVLEKSLKYSGIEDYTIVKMAKDIEWRSTLRLKELKNYLDNKKRHTEYIMFFDSNDVIIRDSPEKAIAYLVNEDCDILFSQTKFEKGYEVMKDIKEWTDKFALEHGYKKAYLNAGVFIARTDFLKKLVNYAMQYVTENDLTREEYRALRKSGKLGEELPDFPKGIGSDQMIFRFIHRDFYPSMKIDYKGKLALRN